jgi:hypothetical protein
MLITDVYRALQTKLHENPDYGVASLSYAEDVFRAARAAGATEVLDYGAGKGRLGQVLAGRIHVRNYEPAVSAWAEPPEPCEFVACLDVLEHIEPDYLDAVLDDLRRVTAGEGLFTVHTGPAAKTLADGRNAHLIQEPPHWWVPKIEYLFTVEQFRQYPGGFMVHVR